MATEIERKFLVTGDGWRRLAESSTTIRQAYLALTEAMSVRIRIVNDAKAFVTIKSAAPGLVRAEFEYPIPVGDARDLMQMRIGLVIEKRRHFVSVGGSRWEVDVFAGAHDGLVIAEIELPHADAGFERPDWLGAEVTDDRRYYNADLAVHGHDGL
jgi:adenylate cyclase